jgi:hypothetical protein
MELNIQRQYEIIYSFFKTTTEPFDDLEWDGNKLVVYFENEKIEEYSYFDLKQMITNF